jgi:hypothetical protein
MGNVPKSRIPEELALAVRETAAKRIAISPPFGFRELFLRLGSQLQIAQSVVHASSAV